MVGRKPKPVEVKIAEGNLGRRPLNMANVVQPQYFDSPIPLTGIARKEWDRIRSVVKHIGPGDAAGLADRCVCWQRLQEAEAAIKQRGMLVETEKGLRANPAISVAKSYRNALQRHDAELGLTPSSRGRVGGGGVTKPSGPGQQQPDDAIESALCGQLPN